MLVAAGPAAAHTCLVPAEIEAGRATVVDVRITGEARPVVAVEVDAPAGVTVTAGAADLDDWRSEARQGGGVRAAGAPIDRFSCDSFPIRVTVPRDGAYLLPLTVTFDDGSTKRMASTMRGPEWGQLVLAGATFEEYLEDPEGVGDGGGRSPIVLFAAAAVAAATGAAVWRRRRA